MRRDDRGSLPVAMLLIVIGIGATLLLGGIVTPQVRSTGNDARRAAELNAAQAGLEAALGQIRATVRTGDGTGDLAALPCGGLSGPVSPAGSAAYRVRVYYLPGRPPADHTQLAWSKTHEMTCTPGDGTTSPPAYALLVSTGTAGDDSSGRTLSASYLFQSRTRANVPGGPIRVYGGGLCLAAPEAFGGDDPLQAGDQLVLRPCAAGDPRQRFTYEPDLHVSLVIPAGVTGYPDGMCLQAAPADHARVTFQPCSDARTQIWSLNNRDNFEGTTDGVDPNGKCFNADYRTSPPTVVINNVGADPDRVIDPGGSDGTPCSGTGGDYTGYKSFFPDSATGTGAAGPRTGQLVNYAQFGRCLDVTENDVRSAFIVIFPCKQQPSGKIQWNQVWHVPPLTLGAAGATGRIWTHSTVDGRDYCLFSAGPDEWVRVRECSPGDPAVPADERWTRRDSTGDPANAYRLESTYNASAAAPLCLQPTEPGDGEAYWVGAFTDMKISKLVLRGCDATTEQKWNASPSALGAVLRDFREN